MGLNSTAPWVSCEACLESMSPGLLARMTWKWIAIWWAYCLPSRTETRGKTVGQQSDKVPR
jgi:hypothetical protein